MKNDSKIACLVILLLGFVMISQVKVIEAAGGGSFFQKIKELWGKRDRTAVKALKDSFKDHTEIHDPKQKQKLRELCTYINTYRNQLIHSNYARNPTVRQLIKYCLTVRR
ncbi:unnamed protein product [Amaranthus hypochondriacus]